AEGEAAHLCRSQQHLERLLGAAGQDEGVGSRGPLGRQREVELLEGGEQGGHGVDGRAAVARALGEREHEHAEPSTAEIGCRSRYSAWTLRARWALRRVR